MASKFELSISTSYVPDWGIVEAFRELFQNALDNETINPENTMGFDYDGNTVRISNKTSKLTSDSLLLGSGTKHDDVRTIGEHGEGYKIAFMVLLRNNKKIKVYNYGAREIWEVRLVNSRKYNGQQVPTVFIEKEAVWKKVPSSDLIIEVSDISEDEYEQIKNSNLHLRRDTLEVYRVPDRGAILLNEEEKGNIYVNGLFVNKVDGFAYGYDFNPKLIKLDRDRKMVGTFDVAWESSVLWNIAAADKKELKDIAVQLADKDELDVKYVSNTLYQVDYVTEIMDGLAEKFYEDNGEDAIPVTSNKEYDAVVQQSLGKPVIVSESKAQLISQSSTIKRVEIKVESLKDKFIEFMNKIESKLTDEELDELQGLIDELED